MGNLLPYIFCEMQIYLYTDGKYGDDVLWTKTLKTN